MQELLVCPNCNTPNESVPGEKCVACSLPLPLAAVQQTPSPARSAPPQNRPTQPDRPPVAPEEAFARNGPPPLPTNQFIPSRPEQLLDANRSSKETKGFAGILMGAGVVVLACLAGAGTWFGLSSLVGSQASNQENNAANLVGLLTKDQKVVKAYLVNRFGNEDLKIRKWLGTEELYKANIRIGDGTVVPKLFRTKQEAYDLAKNAPAIQQPCTVEGFGTASLVEVMYDRQPPTFQSNRYYSKSRFLVVDGKARMNQDHSQGEPFE